MSDERSLFPSWEKIKELPDTETGESSMLIKVILLNLFIYTPMRHIISSLEKLCIFMMNKKKSGIASLLYCNKQEHMK